MAEEKIVKHVVTNSTDGPKVLNSRPAMILAAGAATDGAVELTEGEYEAAKATDWFKFGSAAAKAAEKSDKD